MSKYWGGGGGISYIYTTKVTVIVTYVICIHYYIIIHVLEQTKSPPLPIPEINPAYLLLSIHYALLLQCC